MSHSTLLYSTKLLSYAKINIGLNIINRSNNGYHVLESLMQEIGLHDTIDIKIKKSHGDIIIKSIGLKVNCLNNENSCYQIVDYIKHRYSIPNAIIIELDKKIPIGSGLGGGSSNAAIILNYLNKAFNLNISNEQKVEICKIIGMDTSFFINGSLQYAENYGEITTPLRPIFKNLFFLIVNPSFSISTAWAYSQINKNLPSNKMRYNLLALEEPLKWELFRNDFEAIVIPRYPEIGVLKSKMVDNGAIYSSLSGSGSTVFGIFKNYDQAKTVATKIDHKKYHITVTSPIYR